MKGWLIFLLVAAAIIAGWYFFIRPTTNATAKGEPLSDNQQVDSLQTAYEQRFVQSENGGDMFFVWHGKKRKFASANSYKKWTDGMFSYQNNGSYINGDFTPVVKLKDNELALLPDGETMPASPYAAFLEGLYIQDLVTGFVYYIDNGYKRKIPSQTVYSQLKPIIHATAYTTILSDIPTGKDMTGLEHIQSTTEEYNSPEYKLHPPQYRNDTDYLANKVFELPYTKQGKTYYPELETNAFDSYTNYHGEVNLNIPATLQIGSADHLMDYIGANNLMGYIDLYGWNPDKVYFGPRELMPADAFNPLTGDLKTHTLPPNFGENINAQTMANLTHVLAHKYDFGSVKKIVF